MTIKHERGCNYLRREEGLIAFLYDEGDDPVARRAFEVHLESCRLCRDELESMRGVRTALGAWTPPEPVRGIGMQPQLHVPGRHAPPDIGASAFPWWLQAAAAVLCLGIGLGAANLRVQSGPEGLTVRTGWLSNEVTPRAAAAPAVVVDPVAWKPALDAVEQQLRSEIARVGEARAVGPDADAVVRQTRALVNESERRQQRELALRMADLTRDFHAQRVADLSKIERSLGLIQNSTGLEVLRQREMINSLAVRVSQRP